MERNMRPDNLRRRVPMPPPPATVEDPVLLARIMERHKVINPALIAIYPDGSYVVDGLTPKEFDLRDQRLKD